MVDCKNVGDLYGQLKDKYSFFTGNLEVGRTNPAIRKDVFISGEACMSIIRELRQPRLFLEEQLRSGKITVEQANELSRILLYLGRVTIERESLRRIEGIPESALEFFNQETPDAVLDKIKKEKNLFKIGAKAYFFSKGLLHYVSVLGNDSERTFGNYIGSYFHSDLTVAYDSASGAAIKSMIVMKAYFDSDIPSEINVTFFLSNTKSRPLQFGARCAACNGQGCWQCNFVGGNYG